jgi:hypothetical protein
VTIENKDNNGNRIRQEKSDPKQKESLENPDKVSLEEAKESKKRDKDIRRLKKNRDIINFLSKSILKK